MDWMRLNWFVQTIVLPLMHLQRSVRQWYAQIQQLQRSEGGVLSFRTHPSTEKNRVQSSCGVNYLNSISTVAWRQGKLSPSDSPCVSTMDEVPESFILR